MPDLRLSFYSGTEGLLGPEPLLDLLLPNSQETEQAKDGLKQGTVFVVFSENVDILEKARSLPLQ